MENWASGLGMNAMHGPLGFTDMDREGRLVEGFHGLWTLATIYNYPYHPAHLERLGYCKDEDWMEYRFIRSDGPLEPLGFIQRGAFACAERHSLCGQRLGGAVSSDRGCGNFNVAVMITPERVIL